MSGTTGLMGAVGWQLLGNGHRVYNPVLMRFHSPDRLSPFGRGGINAYAYCGGDPISHVDPSGRFMLPLLAAGLGLGVGMAGQAGAFRAASPSGSDGDSGSLTAWLIGGGIALAGVLGAVAMAGRGGALNLRNSSTPAVPGTFATRPSGAWARGAPSVVQPTKPASSVGSGPSSNVNRIDADGFPVKSMSELPPKVRKRIEAIRDRGPFSPKFDPHEVGNGKFFHEESQLPGNASGMYYRRYLVRFGKDHAFWSHRIILGGSRNAGNEVFYYTRDHGETYVKVVDW